jgi:uncharacterized protein involved in outer membrane biogenesis
MKKIFKIILIVIPALFILLILTPLVFKGKIRDLVLKEANKSLKAKLDIGKINLSFLKNFPNIYIGLNDVIMTGSADFDSDTLLNIKSLSVSTSIMDLLNGSPYEIKKINIDKADVRLKVLADGKANWDIAKASGNGMENEGAKGTKSFRLLLKSLIIKDSKLIYNDLQNLTYIDLEGLNHSLILLPCRLKPTFQRLLSVMKALPI